VSSEKVSPARVLRITEAMRTLTVKSQLEVIDSVKDGFALQDLRGIKFAARSLSEYTRNTKQQPWDAPIEEWIASFPCGATFFDIGANTGAFSLLAAKLHDSRVMVCAVEPAFESFEALVHNIVQNEFGDVITPLPIGLSDETGIETFYHHRLGTGTARHWLGANGDPTQQAFTPVASHSILTFRLDDLIDRFRIPSPTHIKLDVDGAEDRVIAGAQRTLGLASVRELWVELTEDNLDDPTPGQLARNLDALGFSSVREVTRPGHEGRYHRVRDVLFARR
jgi:FkbM family methyltransferase